MNLREYAAYQRRSIESAEALLTDDAASVRANLGLSVGWLRAYRAMAFRKLLRHQIGTFDR